MRGFFSSTLTSMGSSETLDGLETRAAEVSGVLDEVVLVFFWPQAEKVMAEAAIETIRSAESNFLIISLNF